MKKILLISERFYPEEFLVNDVASGIVERGDFVETLTQVPSYPFDKIYEGYANRHLQTTEEVLPIHDGSDDGRLLKVLVHRVNTWFGYNRSTRRKVLNYLHFAWRTFWWAVWHGRKYDRVIVVHTAALTMASAVYALKLLWCKPITIWTQDLWPDAVWGYGFRPSPAKAALLNLFVRSVYGCCDRIAVSCPSYVQRIKEICGRTAEFIPQWEMPLNSLGAVSSGVSATPSAEDVSENKQDGGKLIFMFAGNLGVPQNLDMDIQGFLMADISGAELWIVGSGVRYEDLKAKYDPDGQGKLNIRFWGRQPRNEMSKWFASASVMIISLTKDYAGTLPGKFQSYCATGKPMFGIIDGSTAKLILKYGIGEVAAPDDLEAIAVGYRKFLSADLAVMGKKAKVLSDTLFNREKCLDALLREV